jgi:hypothetical protein
MWDIIANNAGTIIVLTILAVVIFGIVALMVRSKKKGKSCCSSGCVGCPFSGKCGGNN